MATNDKIPVIKDQQPAGLQGHMGTGELVMTVLAFSAPLSTATGFIPQLLNFGSANNGTGNSAPLIYLLIIIYLLFFAIGFAKMGTVMERPGGFYAYITDGLGKKAGLTAAMMSALGYSLVGFFMPGLEAILFQDVLKNFGISGPPWWVWAIIFAALSTFLACRSINFSAKLLFFVMIFEVLIIVVFDILSFAHGAPAGAGGAHVSLFDLSTGTFGVAMLFATGNFYGFEATVIYREECKDPKKTIPRATYIAVIGIGIFYLFTSWGFIAYYGSHAVSGMAAQHPTDLFFLVINDLIGPMAVDIINVIAMFSVFASGLAIHNVSARYFYSLGVDGVIPKAFAKVSPKQHAPYVAALVIGGFWIALILILGTFTGHDAVYTFTRPNVIGNLFVTIILGVVACAVFVYMRKNAKKYGFNIFQTTIAPILGLCGIGFTIVMCAMNLTAFLGTSVGGVMAILAFTVVYAVGSYVYAGWLKNNKPDVYAKIGRMDPDTMDVDEIEKTK